MHDRDILVCRTLMRVAVASKCVNGYTTFTPERALILTAQQ
jgi:hypothetical protein